MNARTDTLHPLDAAVALAARGEGRYRGATSAAYQNMVGPFGGVIGAVLLNAIVGDPQRLGEPVSLTVHYAAPIADGEFEVQVRAVRTNRSTQHWYVELTQEGQVAAFATAVTGLRRETWSATDAVFPQVPPTTELQPMAPLPIAAWTARYEMRFVDGALGTEPDPEQPSRSRLWIRDEPPRPLDFIGLAAICDAFFPRLYVRRPKMVPAGTVALTTYFHADGEQLRAVGSEPVLGVARGLRFGKGFFDQSAEIWSPSGELLATSHQVVYFKE